MSTLFDAAFREVLAGVMRRARRLRAASETEDRARKRRRGVGGTFAGHRAYAPGDDLRLLDWNAFARTRELHVKVLESEHLRALTLLLDTTESMAAGDPPRFRGARRLAALVGGIALAHLDVLTVVAGPARAHFATLRDLEALLALLDGAATSGSGVDVPVAARVAASRGRIVWISDFAELAELRAGLTALAPARRRALGLLAVSGDDRAAVRDGFVELLDPESDERERVRVDTALRVAVAEELRSHARLVDAAFAARGVALIRQEVDHDARRSVAAWTDGGWLEWLL